MLAALWTRLVTLSVEFAPDLHKTASEYKTWESNPVNLTCVAEAIPNATIKWRFNGRGINELDGTYNPSYTIYNELNGLSNLLVRPMGSPGSGGGQVYGRYRCEAENNHGRGFAEINLQQAYPPDAPGIVTIEGYTSTSVTFRVSEPHSDGGLQVKKYHVSYRMEGSYSNNERVESWPSTRGRDRINIYRIDGLIPQVLYLFKFSAENDVGVSTWTNEERFSSPLPVASPNSAGHSLFISSTRSVISTYLCVVLISLCVKYAATLH